MALACQSGKKMEREGWREREFVVFRDKVQEELKLSEKQKGKLPGGFVMTPNLGTPQGGVISPPATGNPRPNQASRLSGGLRSLGQIGADFTWR